MFRNILAMTILVIILVAFSACDRESEDKGPQFGTTPQSEGVPVYHLAVHPLHNPTKLMQAYQPLIEYLNEKLIGAHIILEASRDYANFEEKFRDRKPEFILPNPWQTIQAMMVDYDVIAMAGEPDDFKGIFIVRRDSDVQVPTDLKGKSVSYPSPTALAACIMPQFFLHGHDLDVNTDIENRYVGSQESSIMNVYMGLAAAGATWPPPWRAFQKDHPQEASELMLIWETEPLVNNSVMVRDDIPRQLREQVHKLLLELEGAPEGISILAGMETTRFLPATNRDYDIVRKYISRFEEEVRPVEER